MKTAEADEEYSLLLPAFKSNLAQAKVVAKMRFQFISCEGARPIKRTHIAHTFFENRWVAANSS